MLKCFYILIWIAVFRLCNTSNRKMGLGNESILGKKYLVYFVKSPFSKVEDDAWICAGAIVSPTQILTAAACLVDVDRIYAIAGYKKYVHGSDIENDECTKRWKKKIVKVSVPKEYNMATDKQPDWMNIDLGVATVDEPYNFTDIYPSNCSYEPQSITINYDKKNELENIRATALGWGGIKDRQPKELAKPQKKPQILKEASTIIINKTVCTDLIKGNVSKEVLNEYILCASGNGMAIDEEEETSVDTRPYAPDECPYNSSESGCGDAYYEELRRRQNEKINVTMEQPELHKNSNNKTNSRRTPLIETCQNDHGGPLITWIGTEEMVLGVALNGISNPNFDCVGPRIYVSTAETAKIIKCLLETNETKRNICNDENKEHQVHDIEITWPKDLPTNSGKGDHKISPYLRQGNEEQPLHVRPTKDLGPIDEHGNALRSSQLEIPAEQFYNQPPIQTSTVNPYFQLQNQQPILVPQVNTQQYGEQPQGQMQQSMDLNQQQFNALSQSQLPAYSQQQSPVYVQPQAESLNQQPMETQNQQSDPFSQQQPSSYNQQSFGSQNQQPVEIYKQQQAPAYNIQQPVESFSDPQMGNYNQPPTVPQNQSPADTFNQQMSAIQNQAPKETFNQPPQDIFSQPAQESFNPPTMETLIKPQTEPLSSPNQPQLDGLSIIQPIGSPDQLQMGSPYQQQNMESPDQQQNVRSPDLQQNIGSPDQQQMGSPDQQQMGSPDQQQMGSPQQQMGQSNPQQMEQSNQQQMGQLNPQQVGQPIQQQVGQPIQQQMELVSQPQLSPPGLDTVEQFGQSQPSFNQPQNGNNVPVDPYSQLQMNSYNQPQTKSAQAEVNNQPQGSFNNQQLNPPYNPMETAMNAPVQGDSFTQQQTDPFQQSHTQSNNQYVESFQVPQAPQVEPFSQQQDPLKPPPVYPYNQQQADPLKKNPTNQYIQQPVDQYKPPQNQFLNQQPADSHGQQRSDSFKLSQTDSLQTGQINTFNVPQNNPYKPQPEQLYNQPQDQFRKPEPMQGQQLKTQPFSQQQNSFAQAPYKNPQIEAFRPPPSETEADTYNPLAFLNQNDEEPFKVDSFKPQPIEPYKQLNSEMYNNNRQSFKPAPVEPYEQPHSILRDRGQPRSPQSAPSMQPFIQSKIPASSPTFDASHMHSILRERPPNDPEPLRSETQTFEQIYSQFRVPGSDTSQQGATEQTFEEVYRNLHDGSADLPHEMQLESRFDQPFEQQLEQTNESPKILSMPRAADGNDEIKVRPQEPLELPDYSYDVRRQNDNDSIVTIKSETTLSPSN